MKWSGLILIAIVVVAVFTAGCTQKIALINFNSTNNTSSSSSATIQNVSNVTPPSNITLPKNDSVGVPEQPTEPSQ